MVLPWLEQTMREFIGEIEGVTAVHPKMVCDPPWSPEMMSGTKFVRVPRA